MNFFRSISLTNFRPTRAIGFCAALLLISVAAQAQATKPLLLQGCQAVTFVGTKFKCTNAISSAFPGSSVVLLGSAFSPQILVDIYFDTNEIGLVATNGSGLFAFPMQIPSIAIEGQHWITAVQPSNGAAVQTPFTVESNWSAFRYSPVHKGQNYYENILNASNVGAIDVAWSFTTGASVFSSAAQLDTAAARYNGTTYTVTPSYDTYFGSFDNNLYDVDGVLGTQKWSFATNGGIASSPTVAAGNVYVGSGDGNVYAVGASTGTLVWSFTTGSSVFSSPAVANGVVVTGSNDFNIYGLNAATGGLNWSYPATADVATSAAISNGIAYVADDNVNVYALNVVSGGLVWSDNLAYSCSIGTITNRSGGTSKQYAGSSVISSPAVYDGVVYIGYNNGVYALHAETGATIWTNQLSDLSCQFPSSPAIVNGVLYIGSQDGNVYAVNAKNGAPLWNFTTGGPVVSSPAVANGVVYFGSDDGNVYALNASTGALLWNFPTGNEIVSSPTIANGTLYIGSTDNKMYAFNLEGGQQVVGQGTKSSRVKVPRPDPGQLRPNPALALRAMP